MDYNVQTHSACKTHITDLMKCRQKLLEKKTSSGNHASNSWGYIWGEALRPRKSIDMPKEAIYYLDKHCSKHPDIDKAFTEVLAPRLKSDSSNPPPPLDPKELKAATAVSANKTKEEFLAAIKQTNEDMKAGRDEATEQRAELVRATLWSQCTSLSKEYFDLKESDGNVRLLKNVTKRVLALESKLEIERADTVIDEEDLPAAV